MNICEVLVKVCLFNDSLSSGQVQVCMSRCSSVSIVARPQVGQPGFDSRKVLPPQRYFWAHPASYPVGTGAGPKRSVREANHWHLASAEIKVT